MTILPVSRLGRGAAVRRNRTFAGYATLGRTRALGRAVSWPCKMQTSVFNGRNLIASCENPSYLITITHESLLMDDLFLKVYFYYKINFSSSFIHDCIPSSQPRPRQDIFSLSFSTFIKCLKLFVKVLDISPAH